MLPQLFSPSNITATLLHSIHMYMYSHSACSREKILTFPLTVDQKFPQLGSLSTRCQSFNPPSPNRLIRSNKPIEDCAGSIFCGLYHLMRVVVMTNYRAMLTTHEYGRKKKCITEKAISNAINDADGTQPTICLLPIAYA